MFMTIGKKTVGSRQCSEDGSPKSEDRMQCSEDRRQKTEGKKLP